MGSTPSTPASSAARGAAATQRVPQRGDLDLVAPPAPAQGPPAAREEPDERATILVIEDDPTLLHTLSYNLMRAGYTVLTASTGPIGLDIARREHARLGLVLLDLMLPGMYGLYVLRALRAMSDVPVIILSARGELTDKVDGLELGADDYVTKPFVLGELLARVRAAVRRHAMPSVRPPTSLVRGPLTIEPDRRRVLVGETELALRPKEFGLLVALAMVPGRVFSRQELLDEVWGTDVIVDDRTVDVHISWLRGKLQAAGVAGDAIRTIYGTGYRFALPASTAAAPVAEATRSA